MANMSTMKLSLSAVPSSSTTFFASTSGPGRGTGTGRCARPSAYTSRTRRRHHHHLGRPAASNKQRTVRASIRNGSLTPSPSASCRAGAGNWAAVPKFRHRITVPVVQICSSCRCGFSENSINGNADYEIGNGGSLVSRSSGGFIIHDSSKLSNESFNSWRTGAASKSKEAAASASGKSKEIHGQFIEATEAEEGDYRLHHNGAPETALRDGTAYENGAPEFASASDAPNGRLDYVNSVGNERDLLSQLPSEHSASKSLIEKAEEFQSETGSFWEEDGEEAESRRTESEWASLSPSTEIKRTKEGIDQQDNEERYRLRNGREVFEERAYLVGIDQKGAGAGGRAVFGIKDSLDELKQLADTAGLVVVGSTYQKLETPNPRTYIGGGKVAELKAAIRAFKVETVVFDDELSPGQARNLEKAFGSDVRVCDRTALILDIFSQRAATREASLQVELAQFEYQLPRLTKMWTHLERQAGGMVKGMGEKQIEVDKRILRTRMQALRKDLDSVRGHRQQYRDRRAAVPIPVISLVGYTNAGKSTFLNRLSGAEVLAEDRLFATLDPTTRRVELPNGKDCLFTDTVGFIQKLPTQLVAAFRATLEEITDSSLMVHMVDISHPMAAQQIGAVERVLAELNVNNIPLLTVWNKIDNARNPEQLRAEAAESDDVVCISALTGEGMSDFYHAVGERIKDSMVWVEAVVPYKHGELVNTIHELGIIDQEDYAEQGTLMRAYVPLALSRQLLPFRKPRSE